MSQTTVSVYPAIAREGFLTHREGSEIRSAIVGPSGGIKPGRFVLIDSGTTPSSRGIADPPIVRLPALTGEVTGLLAYGFSLANPVHEQDSSNLAKYAQYEVMPVLFRGRLWMISETAVTAPGSQVYVRFTADGSTPGELGCVRGDTDSGEAVALPGAFFMSTCLAGGLVEVDFQPRR